MLVCRWYLNGFHGQQTAVTTNDVMQIRNSTRLDCKEISDKNFHDFFSKENARCYFWTVHHGTAWVKGELVLWRDSYIRLGTSLSYQPILVLLVFCIYSMKIIFTANLSSGSVYDYNKKNEIHVYLTFYFVKHVFIHSLKNFYLC